MLSKILLLNSNDEELLNTKQKKLKLARQACAISENMMDSKTEET